MAAYLAARHSFVQYRVLPNLVLCLKSIPQCKHVLTGPSIMRLLVFSKCSFVSLDRYFFGLFLMASLASSRPIVFGFLATPTNSLWRRDSANGLATMPLDKLNPAARLTSEACIPLARFICRDRKSTRQNYSH